MVFFEISKDDGIAVITMKHGDSNAFNLDFLLELEDCLEQVESDPESRAVVFTSHNEKIFSVGLDVPWMVANPSTVMGFMKEMFSFLAHMLICPMPTLAAINGHALAGGAVFAFALDYRFMRKDHAYIALPEIDYKVIWPGSMLKLVQRVSSHDIFRDLLLQGKRFYANEALEASLIDGAYSREGLLAKSIEFAKELAKKDRATYAHIKRTMRKELADAVRFDDVGEFVSTSFLDKK